MKRYTERDVLKVYRSSAVKTVDSLWEAFQSSNKNIHAGSFIQAIWRADYKINDEEEYDKAYVYEITFKLGKIYPELIHDSGYDVDQVNEDKYKPQYDTLLYHNTGEGFSDRENLSVIILNKNNIEKIELHSAWTSDTLKDYAQKNFSRYTK